MKKKSQNIVSINYAKTLINIAGNFIHTRRVGHFKFIISESTDTDNNNVRIKVKHSAMRRL